MTNSEARKREAARCDMGCQPDWHHDECAIYLPAAHPDPTPGNVPYDHKTPAEVVYDFAVIRGDLSEQYARDQLAGWIERLVTARVAEAVEQERAARLALVAKIEALADSWTCAPTLAADLRALLTADD